MNKLWLLVCVFILAYHKRGVKGVQVFFETAQDITNIADMSCAYNDDYGDFWVYGCPRSPTDDIYPNRTGFWTNCNRDCTLIYHGGSLPTPEKLWVATYMEGDSAIHVTGKNNPDDTDVQDFGEMNSEKAEWCYNEINLADYPGDPSVINFTMKSFSTGYVLIDKIVVDLGDKKINPITLNSKKDELPTHWVYDDCHYLEEYYDFFAFGCPVEPVEENSTPEPIGYWSPCTVASCKIEFATSPSIIPSSVVIRGYVEGNGNIKVMIPGHQNGITDPIVIETISTSAIGGWIDFDFDLTRYQQYKIIIVLEHNGGTALLDTISYNFNQTQAGPLEELDLPKCTPWIVPTPTSDPITTTIPNSTTTTSNPNPTTTTTGNPNPTTTSIPNPTTTTTNNPNPTTTTPSTPGTSTEKTNGSSVPNISFVFILLTCIVLKL